MQSEPTITINGETLSDGEAACFRVAIEKLATQMQDINALGEDERGQQIVEGYRRQIAGIRNKLYRYSDKAHDRPWYGE